MIPALAILQNAAGFRWTSKTQFFVSCPCHQEKTASLRGTVKEDKLLVKCFGCGAGAKAILAALGLPWASLYADGTLDRHQLRKARIEAREREKQAVERERRLTALTTELRDRDAILALDWAGYEGEVLWDVLGATCRDYSRMEWECETLRSSDYAHAFTAPTGRPIRKLISAEK